MTRAAHKLIRSIRQDRIRAWWAGRTLAVVAQGREARQERLWLRLSEQERAIVSGMEYHLIAALPDETPEIQDPLAEPGNQALAFPDMYDHPSLNRQRWCAHYLSRFGPTPGQLP